MEKNKERSEKTNSSFELLQERKKKQKTSNSLCLFCSVARALRSPDKWFRWPDLTQKSPQIPSNFGEIPSLMDSQEVSEKGNMAYLILRWSLALVLPIVAIFALSLLVGFVAIFVANSSVPSPISVSSQCRIVSSSKSFFKINTYKYVCSEWKLSWVCLDAWMSLFGWLKIANRNKKSRMFAVCYICQRYHPGWLLELWPKLLAFLGLVYSAFMSFTGILKEGALKLHTQYVTLLSHEYKCVNWNSCLMEW